MAERLFSKNYLPHLIEEIQNNLTKRIEEIQHPERLNLAQWKEQLIEDFSLGPLILHDPQPGEPKEIDQTFRDEWGEARERKLFEIKITLSFSGSWQLFDCYGSRSTMVYPKIISISPGVVLFKIILPSLETHLYKQEVDRVIVDLSRNIPLLNTEVAPWDLALPGLIDSLIKKRLDHLNHKRSFMESIGLRINPLSDQYLVPPPVAKKIIPKPIAETAKEHEKEIILVLQENVYRDIIEVIYNAGQAIERKPSLYTGKQEEDLRDQFLLFLETRYDSTTGVGEAFNKKGKTDILLKHAPDGTNLFIAECKFWKGAKKYHETINQLFGYLTTRDSKAAIMMFVEQKDFQGVINTVKHETPNHCQYKQLRKETYESSIAYDFSHPDDLQKIIRIEVMLFHFPKP